MNFEQLVSTIKEIAVSKGLNWAPLALDFIDRDWEIPPNTRGSALPQIMDAIKNGIPERAREEDRVKFYTPHCTVFVALARPQPDLLEAVVVRAVKRRAKSGKTDSPV